VIEAGRVSRMEFVLDTSGVVEVLSAVLRSDRRGRRSKADGVLRLFLLGLQLAITSERSAVIKEAYEVLTNELTLDDQYRLGVRDPRSGRVLFSVNEFYYLTKLINHKLGYGSGVSTVSTGSHGVQVSLSDEQRGQRHDVIRDVCNRLMDATVVGRAGVDYALDATGIHSWSRGRAKPSPSEMRVMLEDSPDTVDVGDGGVGVVDVGVVASSEVVLGAKRGIDGDAAWGIKTAKTGGKEVFFGFHEHTLVQVPALDEDREEAPRLIRRFELTAASADVVDVSLRLLDSLDAPVGQLLVDNHYHYKKHDRWAKQLTRRGIRQVHDLRADEQGFVEYERMRWAGGSAHCPGTPDALGTILRPAPGEKSVALHDAFHEQINVREQYAFRRVTQADENGTQRLECPALAGKVGCALRAGSQAAAVLHGLAIVTKHPNPDGPEGLPKCCSQRTVQVTPPDTVSKLSQVLYWGSRKWDKTFRKRTYVEGSYGCRKNTSNENLRHGLFHITGLPLIHVVMAMVNVTYNLRMIDNWQARTGLLDASHPLVIAPSNIVGFRAVSAEEEYGLSA